MRVLYTSPEIYPMAKTGGLGDVASAFPAALCALGLDVRLLMPAYPSALAQVKGGYVAARLGDVGGLGEARLIGGRTPDTELSIWLVDCPALYDRPGGPHQDELGQDWPDNWQRFALLCHVGALLACDETLEHWPPDVVHCNDWQTGLVPALIKAKIASRVGGRPATVFTIHNLAYQGVFRAEIFQRLGLPAGYWSFDGVEYFGSVSFLKAGLVYADGLTTVSPTYAQEIQTEQLGFGLQGLLRARAGDLRGILNGVDYRVWDPRTDAHIARAYSADDLAGKAECKRALQRELGLSVEAGAPLLGVVSRLTWQKGLDVALEVLPSLITQKAQFVLLGSGDTELENAYSDLAAHFCDRVAVRIGFDEGLAHRIEAGADIFVMPSRYEPSGLNQMYSLRYGTPPVANRVGGLADSVIDATPENIAAGTATGFVMKAPNASALFASAQSALALYGDRKRWRTLQQTGMRQDFGWARPAMQYAALYESLTANQRRRKDA